MTVTTEWTNYVNRVIGPDVQKVAAAKTGIDQTTISRWRRSCPAQPTVHKVVAFARGYGEPVKKALVIAGHLAPEEAGLPSNPVVDLSQVPDADILQELLRRTKRPMPEWDAHELLNVRWQAAAETTIGGWCIQPEGEPPTHEGGISLADFVSREHAEYMADLHNYRLKLVASVSFDFGE